MTRELDERIQAALGAEDAKLYGGSNEMSLMEGVAASFKGKQRGWVMLIWPMTFLMFAAGVFCVVRFFMTDDLGARMAWGLFAVYFIHAVAMLKMWYFMEMNKLNVLREVKRLEVAVASVRGGG